MALRLKIKNKTHEKLKKYRCYEVAKALNKLLNGQLLTNEKKIQKFIFNSIWLLMTNGETKVNNSKMYKHIWLYN